MNDPDVRPIGGNALTVEEAAEALREDMTIIESVDTTGIYGKEKRARDWMRKYFPAYAESGDW